MGFLVFFIFAAVIVAAVIIFSIKMAEETKRNWEAAAGRLKLRFLKGSMFNPGTLIGQLKKHNVKVDTFTRSSGKNSQTFTRYRLDYAKPIKTPFMLTKENFMHSFGKIFGMEDMEIGDPSFDDKVMIKSGNPSALREFLTPARKQQIKSLMAPFSEVTISNSHIEVVIRGTVSNSGRLIANLKDLARVADSLSEDNIDLPERKKKKKSEVKTFRLNEKNLVAGAGDSKVENAIKPKVEPEIINIEEGTPPKKMEKGLPSKKVERGFPSRRERPKVEEKPEIPKPLPEKIQEIIPIETEDDKPEKREIPEKAKEVVDKKSSSLDPEALCNSLFSSDVSTFDSTKKFEEQFINKDISWEGTLISATSFSFDFVFKNTKGVKATFDLLEMETGYSTSKIKTVVHFPEDQLEKLKGLIDQKIKFSGKLLSVDPLVKNIFVSEGKMT